MPLITALTASLIFIFALHCPALAWEGYVARVEDGNTVCVTKDREGKGPIIVVRFYGIDAPTLRQPYGPEAKNRLVGIMPPGTPVTIDSVGEGQDGVVTALVKADGSSVNYQMVADGLAWVNRSTCKALYCRRWFIQEQRAVVNKVNIWSLPMGTPPWQWGR